MFLSCDIVAYLKACLFKQADQQIYICQRSTGTVKIFALYTYTYIQFIDVAKLCEYSRSCALLELGRRSFSKIKSHVSVLRTKDVLLYENTSWKTIANTGEFSETLETCLKVTTETLKNNSDKDFPGK